MRDTVTVGGDCGCGLLGFGLGLEGFHISRQKMSVARFFCAGLARKNFDEWWLAFHQVLQTGLHGAEVVERMHALGAGAKLAGSLWTAQEQHTENGNFVAIKVESFLKAVFVLGDAAVRGADGTDQGLPV